MSKKFDWKAWAIFGIIMGIVQGLFVVGLLTLFSSMLDESTVLLLSAVFGVGLMLSSIVNAGIWIVAGFLYENFLEKSFKKSNAIVKLWVAGFTVTVLTSFLFGTLSVISLLLSAVSLFVSIFITLFALNAFGKNEFLPVKK